MPQGKKKAPKPKAAGAPKATGARKPAAGKGPGPAARRKPRQAPPAPPRKRAWLRGLLYWTMVAAVWGVIAIMGVLVWYAYDLPDVSKLNALARGPSITLLDREGRIVTNLGEVYGEAVQVKDLPPHLPQAVIATEDRRFYSHFGVDLLGLARASINNVIAGRVVQGGSTLTQQLAKNVFLTPERTLKRKAQEVLLAFWLEANFSKDQIITLYLNRVYFGAGAYGVDAAARRYFGKPATEVNLAEAAMLAGLLKAPSRYAPTRDLQAAQDRARVVLAGMKDAGFLDDRSTGAALASPAALGRAQPNQRAARYFVDWVMDMLPDLVSPSERSLTIVTTLDMELQRQAEKRLSELLAKSGPAARTSQGAVLVMDPDGAVHAMVGGRSYVQSQFNRAVQALRQPGSAFKPLVYLAGLESGLTPDSAMVDRPVKIGNWSPGNYNNRFLGPMTLTEALASSTNTVAAQVLQRAGHARLADAALRLGLSRPVPDHPSVALGTAETSLAELTAAYAAFANGGRAVLAHGIAEIRDTDTDEVLFRRRGAGGGRVMSQRHAAEITAMLKAAIDTGTGKAAALDRPAAGKTGTSQDYRDAWFIGYTAHYVAGVWLGNDNNRPMKRVTGGGLPARLWRQVMLDAHEDILPMPLQPRAQPAGGIAGAGDSFGSLVERLLHSLGGDGEAMPGQGGRPPTPASRPTDAYEEKPGR